MKELIGNIILLVLLAMIIGILIYAFITLVIPTSKEIKRLRKESKEADQRRQELIDNLLK